MSLSDTRYVNGARKLGVRIRTIRDALNLPVLTGEIERLLLARTLRRFDRQLDPNENKWAPLKEDSLRRREQKGRPLLVQTGDMRRAIQIIRGSAEGAIYTNTGASIRIGISDPDQVDKARTHQRGYKTIPARKFLGIGRNDVKAVDGLLRRAAENAGL